MRCWWLVNVAGLARFRRGNPRLSRKFQIVSKPRLYGSKAGLSIHPFLPKWPQLWGEHHVEPSVRIHAVEGRHSRHLVLRRGWIFLNAWDSWSRLQVASRIFVIADASANMLCGGGRRRRCQARFRDAGDAEPATRQSGNAVPRQDPRGVIAARHHSAATTGTR